VQLINRYNADKGAICGCQRGCLDVILLNSRKLYTLAVGKLCVKRLVNSESSGNTRKRREEIYNQESGHRSCEKRTNEQTLCEGFRHSGGKILKMYVCVYIYIYLYIFKWWR
jgi:hypothetical protein